MPINAAKHIWYNGKLVPWEKATVHVLAHALHYGSTVFEGERAYPTPNGPVIFRLKDHTRRLFDSAKIYSIEIPYTQDEISAACKEIIEKGLQAASEKLEAAAADIEFSAGRFHVKGTDRSISLFQLAPLAGMKDNTDAVPSYAFGCAVCELEVDPETGEVQIVRYTSVDDVGRAINPLILHGQTHGGIVAGVGQALMERIAYEPASGQLLSASFMDYAMPRADQFPFFTTDISEVPSTTNPLGLRGGGEGGTTPSLATVSNALCDALDIDHIELPATPEKVWRKIKARE